jgi:hypothetical protein
LTNRRVLRLPQAIPSLWRGQHHWWDHMRDVPAFREARGEGTPPPLPGTWCCHAQINCLNGSNTRVPCVATPAAACTSESAAAGLSLKRARGALGADRPRWGPLVNARARLIIWLSPQERARHRPRGAVDLSKFNDRKDAPRPAQCASCQWRAMRSALCRHARCARAL